MKTSSAHYIIQERKIKELSESNSFLLARNKELEDALMGLAARCEESELLTATEPYFKAKGVLSKLKTPTDGK